MKELIYYPGFEITHEDWLKFALLYIDKLCPIIPQIGVSQLSELYKLIIAETNLIDIHQPEPYESEYASLDALEYIERILKTPDRYSKFFGHDILGKWTQSAQQNYRLFRDKYTLDWEKYIKDYKLGQNTEHGLFVHKDLAYIYMTLLAQAIADSRGISTITDVRELDRYYIFTRRPDHALEQNIAIAQGTLQLQLPVNLSEIDINKIIDLRKKDSFIKHLRAFHHELDNFLNQLEYSPDANTPNEFSESLGQTWRELTGTIMPLGAGAVAFGLGLWLLIGSADVSGFAFAKEISGGLSLVTSSVVSIRSTWNHTATKRNTRKYLADISALT